MTQGINPHYNKLINLRLILSIIAKQGAISQTDITKQTTLTKQAISNLISTLKHNKFIQNTPSNTPQNRKVGKPTTLLQVCANSVYSIGMRIGKNKIESGLYDIIGNRVYSHTVDIHSLRTDTLIKTISVLYGHILQHTHIPAQKILGIGIVLPPYQRMINTKNPISYTDSLQLQHTIQNAIYDLLHIPVVIENIATALATKELFFGAAKHLQSFIYVYLGYSVYAGFIHQKRVLSGFEGVGAKFGHIIVEPDGRPCICGNNGCLNQYVSLEILQHHMGIKTSQALEQILENPPPYNKHIETWLQDMSEYMRMGIHTLETLFNAETIILGGLGGDNFVQQWTRILRPLLPSVAQFNKRKIPRIINVAQQPDMIIKGAATLPFYMALETNAQYQGYKIHNGNTPADRLNALLT